MAVMIPADVEQFATDGERQFYGFLEAVAKPNVEFLVWYCPDVEDREPDFILYHDRIGLVVFEVKDWALDQILEADRKRVRLRINDGEQMRSNPLEQAHQYRNHILEAIQKDGHLLSRDSAHYGKPRVPVATAAVLTNINKHEFVEKGLDKVVEPEHTFFWDDLHPQSPYYSDPSGRTFREALQQRFPPLFPFSLNGGDRNRLRHILFPQVRVIAVRKPAIKEFEAQNRAITALDHHQEVFARKFDGGHYILKGPSGTGKTLVLVHKAALLRRYNPQIKRILYVCYNLALVSYIKRLLCQLRVPLGEKGVEVLPFYTLCERIVGYSVEHQVPDGKDYYEIVDEEALERSAEYLKYDAILIDEGQDFSDDMLRVVVNLLNPKTNNLTIAMDDTQNIYSKQRTWSKLGINAKGRTRTLDYVYRSTRELTRVTARFAGQFTGSEGDSQFDLFPNSFDFSGPSPDVVQVNDLTALLDYVATGIVDLIDHEGYGLSEIAVIYLSKDVQGTDIPLPLLLKSELEGRGILATWLSEDAHSKTAYDVTIDAVTLSTVHSIKGLDYAAVFVIGIDLVEAQDRWDAKQLAHIVYVALTRARFRLCVLYITKTACISRIANAME